MRSGWWPWGRCCVCCAMFLQRSHCSLPQWGWAQFDTPQINGGTIVIQRAGWEETHSYKEQNNLIDSCSSTQPLGCKLCWWIAAKIVWLQMVESGGPVVWNKEPCLAPGEQEGDQQLRYDSGCSLSRRQKICSVFNMEFAPSRTAGVSSVIVSGMCAGVSKLL